MPKLYDSRSTLATDPLRNFKYLVTIPYTPVKGERNFGDDGPAQIGFMSLGGLNVNTEVIPYREGGNNTTTRKMPGQTDFSPITLSRGVVVGTKQSWLWFRNMFFVIQGESIGPHIGRNFRTSINIHILQHPHSQSPAPSGLVYKVYNCWPSSLAYSDLDAGGNAVLIEQMVLAHEGWDVLWANKVGENAGTQNFTR